MPNPTRSDVHVNRPLTNIALDFTQSQESFVAHRIFPNVPVKNRSDSYFTIDRGDFNRNQARLRAPGTESAGNGYDVSTATYACDVVAFHKDVDDQIRANTDLPLMPDMSATKLVTTQLLIHKEKDWVTNYFGGGVWTTDYDGNSTGPSGSTNEVYYWSDYTNSDPIRDVRTVCTSVQESTGYRPNVMVAGRAVLDKLLDHPDVIDRIKYGQSNGNVALANKQILAQLFDVERIEVMNAIENTADEGQTNSHSFIGGKKALLVYAPAAPSIDTPSAGYTFSWTGYTGATNNGIRISKLRMEHLKSDRIEGEVAYDHKLVSADLGAFFDTIIA